jgi:C_GCAxxG_C_C family probable redox protein
MMSKVDLAVSYFREGFACSQAILAVYGEPLGLEQSMAFRIGEGFAGGIAGMGKTCGAVAGASMVIGLKYGRTRAGDKRAKEKTAKLLKKFIQRFEARNHSIECKELIGCEIDTPGKSRQARRKGVFSTICPGLVRDAAEIIEEIL